MGPSSGVLTRKQTYRFPKPCEGSVRPGFVVQAASDIRYTYPMWINEQPLAGTKSLGRPVNWADGGKARRAALDSGELGRAAAAPHLARPAVRGPVRPGQEPVTGTLDFRPAGADGLARLRLLPRQVPRGDCRRHEVRRGDGSQVYGSDCRQAVGRPRQPAAGATWRPRSCCGAPPHPADLKAVAGASRLLQPLRPVGAQRPGTGPRLVQQHVGLHRTEPAHETGAAWVSSISAGARGRPYTSLGPGAVAHWKRTGETSLLRAVEEMTRNMDSSGRGKGPDACIRPLGRQTSRRLRVREPHLDPFGRRDRLHPRSALSSGPRLSECRNPPTLAGRRDRDRRVPCQAPETRRRPARHFGDKTGRRTPPRTAARAGSSSAGSGRGWDRSPATRLGSAGPCGWPRQSGRRSIATVLQRDDGPVLALGPRVDSGLSLPAGGNPGLRPRQCGVPRWKGWCRCMPQRTTGKCLRCARRRPLMRSPGPTSTTSRGQDAQRDRPRRTVLLQPLPADLHDRSRNGRRAVAAARQACRRPALRADGRRADFLYRQLAVPSPRKALGRRSDPCLRPEHWEVSGTELRRASG